jgi:two-component system chemotaxis response regulator CheB
MRHGKPLRYRCQVGHTMTGEVLAKEQENVIDEAMRIALRIIEERAELVSRMAEEGRSSGRRAVAELYDARAAEYRQYADALRRAVLLSFGQPEIDSKPDREGGESTG